MRIGIDIDGVLTNVMEYVLEYGSKYFYEKYEKLNININTWSIEELFNVTKEEDKDCWQEITENYSLNEPPRAFASEIISKLKEEGNYIYIITARCNENLVNFNNTMNNMIKDWLSKNKINYDKLIFCPTDKLSICLENNIDIMIEDKSENINKISTKIPVICFNAEYNKNCIGNNIYRAYSWYDIYYKIKMIGEQNNER